MKFCIPHWEKLKNGIKQRGLWHLVPTNGKEAAEKLEAGQPDPLMDAHNRVMMAAIRDGGPYILTGDYCPLCELGKAAKAQSEPPDAMIDDWVNGACDDVLYDHQKYSH